MQSRDPKNYAEYAYTLRDHVITISGYNPAACR